MIELALDLYGLSLCPENGTLQLAKHCPLSGTGAVPGRASEGIGKDINAIDHPLPYDVLTPMTLHNTFPRLSRTRNTCRFQFRHVVIINVINISILLPTSASFYPFQVTRDISQVFPSASATCINYNVLPCFWSSAHTWTAGPCLTSLFAASSPARYLSGPAPRKTLVFHSPRDCAYRYDTRIWLAKRDYRLSTTVRTEPCSLEKKSMSTL